jgi:hypothetical protein
MKRLGDLTNIDYRRTPSVERKCLYQFCATFRFGENCHFCENHPYISICDSNSRNFREQQYFRENFRGNKHGIKNLPKCHGLFFHMLLTSVAFFEEN